MSISIPLKYEQLKSTDDSDIKLLIDTHKMPEISKFISIDEQNYWTYVTETENVFYYKVYNNSDLVASVHCELYEKTLYLSILVFPKYQKQGIGTLILKDIQIGKLPLEYKKIEASIDETNIASIKLFEKCGFSATLKEDELITYLYLK